MRPRVAHAAFVILALAFAGCADSSQYDTTDPIVLEPVRDIGGPGTPPGARFGRIGAFAADSAGTLYVAEIFSDEIRAFDASGRPLWTTGRTGEGPGEFEDVEFMTAGFGQVYVVDEALSRVTVLDSHDGGVTTMLGYDAPNAGMLLNGQPRLIDRDRLSFGVLRLALGDNERYPEYGLTIDVARLSVDLATGHTAETHGHDRFGELHLIDRPGGRPSSVNLPFAASQIWTPNPHGGHTIAWNEEYVIAELGPEDDTLRVVGRDVPPRRVTLAGRRLAREQAVLQLRPYIGVEAARDVPLPYPQQQLVGLAYSRDGRQLWVRRTDMDPDPVFDVFTAGHYRCTIRLDADGAVANSPFEPPVVIGGRVFHHATDARTDVPFILVFELDGSCEAAANGD